MKRLKMFVATLVMAFCTVCGCVLFCFFQNSSSYASTFLSTDSTLPSTYDSRNLNIVTAVKEQGDTNLCWAYSSIAVAETSILKSGIDSTANNTNLSLSPVAVGYSRYKRNADPLNNTPGEYSSTNYLKASGNPTYAETLFSQWCGPISSDISANADSFENSAYRFVESSQIYDYNFSKEEQIMAIKKAIVKYGAVTFSYNNVREKYYYNPKNETGDNVYPHACTLIGWDDNILSTKFEPNGATQNGGWLVKNSYKSLPYFYLSYDTSISSSVYAFEFKKKEEYDYNYFYDYVFDDFLNYTKNCRFAGNVYQAKKGDNNYAEYLKAVNVAALGKNYSCDIEIYTDLIDNSNPTSGNLAATATASFETSGYKTINLSTPVKLTKNSNFGVVVRLNGDSKTVLRLAHCASQSFEKTSSGWQNLTNCTARIKAFTSLDEESQTTIDIAGAEFSSIQDFTFTGDYIKPQILATFSNTQLIESKDYVVEYYNNQSVGQAQIVVKGIGNYTGTKAIEFNITPANIQNCNIEVLGNFTYDAQPQKPKINAKYNGLILTENLDYNLEYQNNINAGGSAIIKILGIGNFVNNTSVYFEIKKADKPSTKIEKISIDNTKANVLADVALPEGWAWADPTIKITKNLNSAYIVYVGEDKDNYLETTSLISINQEENEPSKNEETNNDKAKSQKQIYIIVLITASFALISVVVVLIVKRRRY